ncbi:ribonuclease H1 small subunit, partial [Lophiostoma macrostomum CBS 122681]
QAQTCTPNLLPAHIHHNGRIPSTSQYWMPETDESGKPHAYFRGRHLHGTVLRLPENYTGAVMRVTDKDVPKDARRENDSGGDEEEDEDEDGEMDDDVEIKIAQKVAEFEEMIVWGHGGVVDESEDVYARGIREWIGFAEAMHREDGDGDEEQ